MPSRSTISKAGSWPATPWHARWSAATARPALQGRHFTAHMTLEAATKAARDFAHCVTLGQTIESQSVFVDARRPAGPGPHAARAGARRRSHRRRHRLRARQPRRGKTSSGAVHALGTAVPVAVRKPPRRARAARSGRPLPARERRVRAAHRLFGRRTRSDRRRRCSRRSPATTSKAVARCDASAARRWSSSTRSAPRAAACARSTAGACRCYVDGEVRGFCGMIRDVTEERRAARNSARQATRIAELYRIAAAASVAQDEKRRDRARSRDWRNSARSGPTSRASMTTASRSRTPPARGRSRSRSTPNGERLRDELESDDVFVVRRSGRVSAVARRRRALRRGPALRCGRVRADRRAAGASPPTDRDYIRALAVLIGSAIQQGERTKRLDSLAFGDALTGLAESRAAARSARANAALGAPSPALVRRALRRHRSFQDDQRHLRTSRRRRGAGGRRRLAAFGAARQRHDRPHRRR